MNSLSPTRSRLRTIVFLLGFVSVAVAVESFVPGRLVELNRPLAPPAEKLVAIVGARLVDGRGGPPIDDATVVVRGSSIVAAGPRRDVRLPAGTEVFDAVGLTLVPGLVDAHLHGMHQPRVASLFLGHGVTS